MNEIWLVLGAGGSLQNNKPWCNKSVAHYQTSQQTNCIHQPLRTEKPHFSSPQTTESETRHSPVEGKTAAAGPPSALASNINPISRKHAGFGPRYANVRPAAASHACKRTPDGDIFTSALPPSKASVHLYCWCGESLTRDQWAPEDRQLQLLSYPRYWQRRMRWDALLRA